MSKVCDGCDVPDIICNEHSECVQDVWMEAQKSLVRIYLGEKVDSTTDLKIIIQAISENGECDRFDFDGMMMVRLK
jgi:hypothetical protein